MALSDEERSRFEELELRFAIEDSERAPRLQHPNFPHPPRRRKAAVIMIVVGMLTVITSIALSAPAIGVAGFVIMVAGGIVGTPPPPPEQRDTSPPGPTRPSGPQSSTKPL
ncbi:DUF3040 domain-containing protein [Arthrobacter sp. TB 23]|uniref:DUF3040 domain-containing protein n=1 Tax=Arthrobacter sp. TB 23 TaxID=494419 RepID=UPI0002EFB253|nr:DUF3040 domain-containing protein [Arthrobacter sp. TB 23]